MITIEIDFDVYKELTNRRAAETVTYNDVLRELLGLKPSQVPRASSSTGGWTTKGVTFPEGTEFRANYKGNNIVGKVESNALVVNGKQYKSPSAAAVAVTGSPVNGWRFWTCKRPGDPSFVGVEVIRNLRSK